MTSTTRRAMVAQAFSRAQRKAWLNSNVPTQYPMERNGKRASVRVKGYSDSFLDLATLGNLFDGDVGDV